MAFQGPPCGVKRELRGERRVFPKGTPSARLGGEIGEGRWGILLRWGRRDSIRRRGGLLWSALNDLEELWVSCDPGGDANLGQGIFVSGGCRPSSALGALESGVLIGLFWLLRPAGKKASDEKGDGPDL